MSPSDRDRAAFHPDLRRMAPFLPRAAFTKRTVLLMQRFSRLPTWRTPPWVAVHELGPGVTVRTRDAFEGAANGAALLWIRGGGYAIGCAAQDDRVCRAFGRELGIPVVAVDYRLAPQNPYPAGLDDCHSAYLWLTRQEGVDPSRIVVAGASAGGGLAAALCQRLHDEGHRPALQVLVYPMLDDRAADQPNPLARFHRMWNRRCNRLAWDLYLRDADPATAAPAKREDLTGLAPAWISVGTLDPLHDEGVAYAGRLADAGVACSTHVVEGAFHCFDAVVPKAPASEAFFAQQCDAIRSTLGL